MNRKLMTTTLSVCLALGLAAGAAAATFRDVPANIWYHDAVVAVSDKGLMSGASDVAFLPDAPVTRGMVATVLWRLAGTPAPVQAAPFADVATSQYYAEAAAWAGEQGVASGYGDGRFGGGDAVTREQLAVFLYRFALVQGTEVASGVLDQYADAKKVSAWASEGMAHAVGSGLITGRDNNMLDPQGTATRAQLAVILQRLMIPAVG